MIKNIIKLASLLFKSSNNNSIISGKCFVIDGDTIQIKGTRIRLAGIDAPELNQPWGKAAKYAMVRLCKGKIVSAHLTGEESYNRKVAICYLSDGRDIGAEIIKQGYALDFTKYSNGKYKELETADARKKLKHKRNKY